MNLHTDMLRAFTMVAQLSSVSQAAKQLSVSKSMISKRIMQLEASLGATLLMRTSRAVCLTPAGEVYLAYAQRALQAMQQGDEGLRALREEPTGLIRVTAPVSWGHRELARALPEFLANYPRIEIELILQDKLLDIAKEQIDIALRWSAHPDLDYVAIPIQRLNWVICASSALIAAVGEPLLPEQLRELPCMNYWSASSDDAWVLRQGGQETTLKVRNRLRANNPEVVLNACLAGLGFALLPRYCCHLELAEGRLQQVLAGWTPVTKYGECITAVVAPDRVGFSRNQTLLRFLKIWFAQPQS